MKEKLNWFDWSKSENEKTYTEYCGHRDLWFMVGKCGCRSCGTEMEWDGKSYDMRDKLPKVKWNKDSNGTTSVSDC